MENKTSNTSTKLSSREKRDLKRFLKEMEGKPVFQEKIDKIKKSLKGVDLVITE